MCRLYLVAASGGYALAAVHELIVVTSCCRACLYSTQTSVVVDMSLVAPWLVESFWTRDQTRVSTLAGGF